MGNDWKDMAAERWKRIQQLEAELAAERKRSEELAAACAIWKSNMDAVTEQRDHLRTMLAAERKRADLAAEGQQLLSTSLMDEYKIRQQAGKRQIVSVQTGIYRHYKGEFYLVLGVAQHTEREEQLVLYVPLTGNEGRAGLRLRARPLTGERGFLTPEDGQERFVWIGQEMPDASGEIVG